MEGDERTPGPSREHQPGQGEDRPEIEEKAPAPPKSGTVDRAMPGSLSADEDLPIVARMVVEIRSDGRRTIARGALEDAQQGEKVAIRAEGTTPLSLAAALTRAIARAPFVSRALSNAPFRAGRAVRAFLTGDDER